MGIRAGIFRAFGRRNRWRSPSRRRSAPAVDGTAGGWSHVVEALKGEIGPDPRPRHVAFPSGRSGGLRAARRRWRRRRIVGWAAAGLLVAAGVAGAARIVLTGNPAAPRPPPGTLTELATNGPIGPASPS